MDTKNLENRILLFGLVSSVFIHVMLISGLSFAAPRVSVIKPATTIEVTYEPARKEPVKTTMTRVQGIDVVQSDRLPLNPPVDVKVLSKNSNVFSSFQESIQEMSKSNKVLAFNSGKMPPMKIPERGRTITVPMFQSEKVMDPRYLSYTQNIRQKIRQRAYFYAENPNFESGEVYLTFVLSSSGVLEGVRIIKEKTAANAYVQQIGVRSIEESAPFPQFPSDLNFPELTFNVIISFELSE